MTLIYVHTLFRRNTNPSNHLPAPLRFLQAGQGRLFVSLFMDHRMLQVTIQDDFRGLDRMRHDLLATMGQFGLFGHWTHTGDCVLERFHSNRLFETYFMQ
jgi:hypothetical protein